jgi:hypothetical protein
MSQHMMFRRQPVQGQFAQQQRTITIPAPTRGIVQSENEAFMQPGAAIVQDNWMPTMRGVKLRGGHTRWCDLHALDATVPPVPSALRQPVISAFEYSHGNNQLMFAAQTTKLFNVTTNTPVLVKSGQTSGNYAAAQLANAVNVDYLLAVNDAGDPVLRFNGSTWITLDPSAIAAWVNNTAYAIGATAKDTTDNTYWRNTVVHTSAAAGTFAADRTAHPSYWTSDAGDGVSWITGPTGSAVVNGRNLCFVWKYRNRLFFLELNSMNAWYLPLNAVGGALLQIPLSGAATKGGKLLFGATWSIDAGDGIDDKCCFITNFGEVLIFTGSNPSDASNWRQEGRYQIPPPLGMNASIQVGGDLLIATVEGIVPISSAITKTSGQLELAMITLPIKQMWRDEVTEKRAFNWSMERWDEYGGLFITLPGGKPGERRCLATNNATGAFCRYTGWDAMCFVRMRADMFFGTQDGIIMQADRTGYDDGKPYVATLVGGWEMFQAPSQQNLWYQARAVFTSPPIEPFEPQLSATTDFIVVIPPPPPPGPDPGPAEVWDQGLWNSAHWDVGVAAKPAMRNTLWVSIGMTGFSHAPIVQVTVAQQARPNVELIAIAATFEKAGITV